MAPTKTHSVTITFAGNDLHPPVFVAGSFTNPPWRPEVMEAVLPEHRQKDYGQQHVYSKTFGVPEGRWEYKFRLGQGSWWVCDEKEETVQDKHGNVNNLLIVGAERGTGPAEPRTPSPQKKHATPMTAIDKVHEDEFQDDEKYEDSPLMSHEKPSLMTAGGLEVDPGYHGRRTSLGATINRVHTFIPPEPTHEDLKDPELEEFPGNKSGILHRMYTLRQELPIDDSSHLDNNNGTDPMAYHLTRSLEHLSSSIKPPIIAHIERASPKGTSSESSPTGQDSLDGTVENAAVQLPQRRRPQQQQQQQPRTNPKTTLLCMSSPADGLYGTLRLAVGGIDGTRSSGTCTPVAVAAMAHTDDDHSGDESGEKREREPKLDRADAIGSDADAPTWGTLQEGNKTLRNSLSDNITLTNCPHQLPRSPDRLWRSLEQSD
ncbi:MAG: hypothetical protein LQ340_006543 [Diploschistes diacapsis]|nr:MAG: hypothetical protein LQ340_006543 [Diploschistes diacapsis]